jgi:hypothetical protein
MALGDGFQFAALVLDGLAVGRDAEIEGDAAGSLVLQHREHF